MVVWRLSAIISGPVTS